MIARATSLSSPSATAAAATGFPAAVRTRTTAATTPLAFQSRQHHQSQRRRPQRVQRAQTALGGSVFSSVAAVPICAHCLHTRVNAPATFPAHSRESAAPASAAPWLASQTAAVQTVSQRRYASVATAAGEQSGAAPTGPEHNDDFGPIQEYDRRVACGELRNDEHQRGIIQSLQRMHDELRRYDAPPVVHPSLDSLKPQQHRSLLSSWFGGRSLGVGSGKSGKMAIGEIPESLPLGLYLYGDVGSGKTMLMDLFYDTLPKNVRTKTRIHFHNFMQDVHKRLHRMKMQYGIDIDAVPFVAADIAEKGNVLCFDEFQCTDVADAMILRRLLEALMSHGVVLVTTSNRHPDELYKNGVQRESFIPAIELLKHRLQVINLDSPTDYRKIPRPPSGVYYTHLDEGAQAHAEKWFRFLGDREHPEPHAETQTVWGREIHVPRVSGRCAWFTFDELIGQPTSAADYLELVRAYDAFIVTDCPGMTYRQRDLARRFITFIDAVYESQAKLVLTSEVPLNQLFVSKDELLESLHDQHKKASEEKEKGGSSSAAPSAAAEVAASDDAEEVDSALEGLVEGMEGHNITSLKNSNLFSGEEEAFAFGRALSRLSHMGSKEWVERGMGLEGKGGKAEHDNWIKTRSRRMEDSM